MSEIEGNWSHLRTCPAWGSFPCMFKHSWWFHELKTELVDGHVLSESLILPEAISAAPMQFFLLLCLQFFKRNRGCFFYSTLDSPSIMNNDRARKSWAKWQMAQKQNHYLWMTWVNWKWRIQSVQMSKQFETIINRTLKSAHTHKCVLLVVTSLGYLSFKVQCDVYAEFNTKYCFHIHLLKDKSVCVLIWIWGTSSWCV